MLRKKKSYVEALDQFDKAVLADPKNYRYIYWKGNTHLMLNDHTRAIAALETCIKMKDDHVPAYVGLAECYKHQKDVQKVVDNFNHAFVYESDSEKKIEYKIQAIKYLIVIEDFVLAKQQLNALKKFNPEVFNNIDILYQEARVSNKMGDYNTAKVNMLAATKMVKSPAIKDVAKYYFELGFAFYKTHQYDNATEAWKKADYGIYRKWIAEHDPALYFGTAQSYFRIYEHTLAKKYVETALKVRKDYSPAHVLLARIALTEVKQDAAIHLFHEALKIETDELKKGEIYKELAPILMNSGKYNEAIQAAVKCLKVNPRNHEMCLIQAMANYRQKNYPDAIKTLESMISTNQDLGKNNLSPFYFALATIYKASNMQDQAKMAFQECSQGMCAKAAQVELANMNQEEED